MNKLAISTNEAFSGLVVIILTANVFQRQNLSLNFAGEKGETSIFLSKMVTIFVKTQKLHKYFKELDHRFSMISAPNYA